MRRLLVFPLAISLLGLAAWSCAGSESVDGASSAGGSSGSDAGGDAAGSGGASSGGSSGSGGSATGKPNGSVCALNSDCKSAWCVDGVCCEGACDGACRACNLPGKEGSCVLAAAATDPEQDCGDPTDTCSGKCDGTGACAYPGSEKLCGSAPTCASGKQSGEACDGAGKCQSVETSCGYFQCFGSACMTTCSTDADCTSDGWCDAATKGCEAKKADGKTCQSGNECSSDVCVSGVCCNVACDAPATCWTGQCVCGSAACAAGKACTTWYVDSDKDGHGDAAKPKPGCEDTGPLDGASYAKTGDDCYDLNPNAFPGQTAFFPTNRGDGSWDYNCNGAPEYEHPDVTGMSCGDCGAKVGQLCYSCGALPGVNLYGFGCSPSNKCTSTGIATGYKSVVQCGQGGTLYSCSMCGPEVAGAFTIQGCR